MAVDALSVVSFNMNGRNTGTGKLPAFKSLLQSEDIICLQEVTDVSATRSHFRDYPYVFTTTRETQKGPTQRESNMILSKLPYATVSSAIIQVDPGGDQWQRHAQYVRVKLGADLILHLFHYHNTYNWGHDNSAFEREGLRKFAAWIRSNLGIATLAAATDLVVAGDFNLGAPDVTEIMTPLSCATSGIDFICADKPFDRRGSYTTIPTMSDHDAIWAVVGTGVDTQATIGPAVQIFNLAHGEYMYAADYAPFDDDRRRVFTWRPKNPVSQGTWRLEPVSPGRVRIFNTMQCEYMYAADYAPFDNDRRRVFTWRPGSPIGQGDWSIDDHGSSGATIFNLHQGEYLYAADYAPFDNDRRQVFTWRPKTMVSQGYWKIMPTGDGIASWNGAPALMRIAASQQGGQRGAALWGIDTAGQLRCTYQETPGGKWTGWSGIWAGNSPGNLIDIAAAQQNDGRVALWVLDKRRRVYHCTQNVPGGDWSGWSAANWNQAPALMKVDASQQGGQRGAALWGIDTAGQLRCIYQETPGGKWTGWSGIWAGNSPGNLIDIAAAQQNDSRVALWVLDSSQRLHHCSQTSAGGDWSGWSAASWNEAPALMKVGASQQGGQRGAALWGIDTAGQLRCTYQETPGGKWTGWSGIWAGNSPGNLIDIAAAQQNDGRVALWVLDSSQRLHHCSQTSAGGDWSSWSS